MVTMIRKIRNQPVAFFHGCHYSGDFPGLRSIWVLWVRWLALWHIAEEADKRQNKETFKMEGAKI